MVSEVCVHNHLLVVISLFLISVSYLDFIYTSSFIFVMCHAQLLLHVSITVCPFLIWSPPRQSNGRRCLRFKYTCIYTCISRETDLQKQTHPKCSSVLIHYHCILLIEKIYFLKQIRGFFSTCCALHHQLLSLMSEIDFVSL